MRIVGYADRFSVAPGETIRFMVSCEPVGGGAHGAPGAYPRYQAEIVRLIHGDTNPEGPGFKEQPVQTSVSDEYQGRGQRLPAGSYVTVPSSAALEGLTSFTLIAWIWPTTPGKGEQALLSRGSSGLFVDADGRLLLRLQGADGATVTLRTPAPLRARSWYFVAASYDAQTGAALLSQQPYPAWPVDDTRALVEERLVAGATIGPADQLLIAAARQDDAELGAFYNGKIEAPALFGSALGQADLEALRGGAAPATLQAPLVAAWDFSLDIPTDFVRDTSPNELHARTVNIPARAVTGHAYRGDEVNGTRAPQQYGAIHFHDDDLEDARWEVDFELSVPDSLRSGVYAAKLTVQGGEDYVPFFVRPKDRKASAKILWLVPTNSYLAYANFHEMADPDICALWGQTWDYPQQEQDKFTVANRLLSLYDLHSDKSGTFYSSRLRPIVTMRPKWNEQLLGDGKGYPHQFNADLHLVDWLVEKGLEFDVATDEDLQHEGVGLLNQYRVVLTGTHHEYWSSQGLDHLEAYLQGGGRFLYLAGNGLYWIISYAPHGTHVLEVRRWAGTRSWTADPGERYHSTSGELGGLWRERSRAPQKYVGVGMISQGFDYSLPYIRQPGSFDPRAAWIFEGVGPDEPIGGFGLVMGGAGGFEVDRVDPKLGSPPHTLVLATATGFSDSYQFVVEEVEQSDSHQGGSVNSGVRGDLAYFETPNGGAVFSVGSISYCGSLSHNNYDNNVSRITENVIRRFLRDDPLS